MKRLKNPFLNVDDASIKKALDTIKLRERQVLISRFGLFSHPVKTLRTLAIEFGLSSKSAETIRQVESRGLRQLEHPTRKAILNGSSCGLLT